MADKVLKIRIQHKYDSVANWRNSNLILLKGELAIDETNGIKIGDGRSLWNNLSYVTDNIAKQLSSLVITINSRIDDIDSNLQSAVLTLNDKIENLESNVNNINTNIEILENNEIPTSKLIDPLDETNVVINCGDSTD